MGTSSQAVDQRHGFFFEDLSVGMEASHSKIIRAEDIQAFADLSGDDNPAHLCSDFAASTIFGEPVAHGLLTASLLSTIIGTKLPGPGCAYLSQTLRFYTPVRIGDTVVATARITELIPERKRAVFACTCTVDGRTVLDGEAETLVPTRRN